MPQYREIRGDAQIVKFLHTVRDRAEKDQSRGFVFLRMETLAETETFYAEFAPLVQTVSDLLKERRKVVRKTTQKEQLLKVRLRSVWAEVNTRVKTGMDSNALYAHYGLDETGDPPVMTNRAGWMELATQVVAGMEDARVAGFHPVEGHDAVVTALSEASDIMTRLGDLKEEINTQRNLRDAMRPQGRQLCRRVVRDLRCILGDETHSRQREIMRAYGVTFRDDPNETAEESGEQTTPTSPGVAEPTGDTATVEPEAGTTTGESTPDPPSDSMVNATGVSAFSPSTNDNGTTQYDG